MRAIDSFIISAGIIFDNAIVKNEIAMTDMPAFQYSTLVQSLKDEFVNNRKKVKKNTIDAMYNEMSDLIDRYNIPSKELLLNASIDNDIKWDPVEQFCRSPEQSEESYVEQLIAIKTCKDAIDSIMNFTSQTTMTKSVVIRGYPGAGKSFCMLYMTIYAISQGLFVKPVAKMSHRGLQIGGTNWDKLLFLHGDDHQNKSIHCRAEVAINKIKKDRKKEDFILSLNVLFADELGQLSAEELSIYDIILRNVRGSKTFMGGILIIGTLDHLQIQPINGRPFLTANAIIPCFKMISLKNTVRATGSEYVELQSLVRKDYSEFDSNPELIERFCNICSRIFTFVNDWNDEHITPNTFRIFSKRHPAKEALDNFQTRMFNKYTNNLSSLRQRKSIDTQKSRFGHDWVGADSDASLYLDKKCREPQLLLFEVGLIYSCTYNDNVKSNSQKAILFELPSQSTLDSFGAIKVLLAPPGCKDVSYEPDSTKESYFSKGYKEISVGCNPRKVYSICNKNLQVSRKQYGLKHYVAGTIHYAMGDTLPSLVTTFSNIDKNYSMWDKGQLLVIISRTKNSKDTIFVGDKEDTLNAMVTILKTRTQWTDHMENILNVVTINSETDERNIDRSGVMDHSGFPFRTTDISIPTDCSGYVYMLISLRTKDFCYIGKTKDLHQRMRSHQSGYGSQVSQPEHLRPYAYLAYICGFNHDERLMFYIEKNGKKT